MKPVVYGFGALVVWAVTAAALPAQYPAPSYPQGPMPCAPGFGNGSAGGACLDPMAGLNLPPAPFGGVGPPPYLDLGRGRRWGGGGLGGARGVPVFFSHPFVRSPRDYYMLDLP
jgi:hypothetical protein